MTECIQLVSELSVFKKGLGTIFNNAITIDNIDNFTPQENEMLIASTNGYLAIYKYDKINPWKQCVLSGAVCVGVFCV